MNPPSQIMTEHLLPTLRGLVAHNLNEKGYSQSRIARMLAITQASVSLYLTHDSFFYKQKMRALCIEDSDTERYVKTLVEDLKRSRVEAIHTLLCIWRNLLASGLICSIHKKEASILEDCDVCMRIYRPIHKNLKQNEVLSEVERAAKIIEDSYKFQSVIPAVSVNIVMALQGAKTDIDVAAFPGRIMKIHGRAKHTLPAEFGSSHHMARMVLSAMGYNPDLRAAINIKYDDEVADIIDRMKLNVVHISNKDHKSIEGDVVVSAFQDRLSKSDVTVPQVVIDEGGKGLEPITYIFGKTATEVANLALEIAKQHM